MKKITTEEMADSKAIADMITVFEYIKNRNGCIEYGLAEMVAQKLSASALDLQHATNRIAAYSKVFAKIGEALDGVRDDILDADTCYRDPDLPNTNFEALSGWAQDLIISNSPKNRKPKERGMAGN